MPDILDTDDYKLDKNGKKVKAHRIVFNKGEDDGKKGVSEEMKKSFNQFVQEHTPDLTEEQVNELVAELQEVLGKDDPAGEWISDFVHSDNPKFAGKSKEKRKQMALAAYYAKKRNEEVEIEEVEQIDEDMKSAAQELSTYAGKHGGMDKADFHKAAKHMAAGDHKALHKHIQSLDSDPRDKILTTLHKHGNDIKRYGYSTEEVEINEMDKSQPSSSRGAEGHPIGKKAKPVSYDKAKKDAYGALKKALNKKYQKIKEEEHMDEALKGKQHKIDKNKNGKIDAHDFKLLRKEDAELEEGQSHQARTTMKHIVNPTPGEKKAAKDIKPGIAGFRDRVAMLKSAEARGALKKEEAELEEGMKAYVSSTPPKLGEKGSHDVVGKDGKVVKSFPHSKEGMMAAQAHLKSMKEETKQVDEASDTLPVQKMTSSFGLGRRKSAEVATQGSRTGLVTKKHATSLKQRILSAKNLGVNHGPKGKLPEEAEQVDEAWPGTDEYKKKFPDTKRTTGRGERHDIEATSTGVKATRRYSTDDTTEKPENAPKRGRGRPKKDKFAEAVDFLMSVNEDQFEELIAEGFDSFFEAYERAVAK